MDRGSRMARETMRAISEPDAPELFTATVTAVSYPYAKILPFKATTPAEQLIGTALGSFPKVGDRVLCCWISGEPFIILTMAAGSRNEIRLSSGASVYGGSGSPEGVVTAPPSSLYMQSNGAGGRVTWVKTSGSGNTGWMEMWRAERRKSKKEYQANPGATTFANSLWAAGIVTNGTLSNVDSGTGNWIQAASPATINTIGTIQGGAGCTTRFELDPDFSMAMRSPSTVTGGRWWYGCFSGDPTTLDDPSVSAGFGFRHAPAIGDTTYKAYTNDASGGGTITDTGVVVAASIAQELRCICDGVGVNFYIGGELVARHTTNLPPDTTALLPMATATSLTASASRAVRVGRITVESAP